MKSLWKSLIHTTVAIGVSACSTATLIADDSAQPGLVRISKPSTAAVQAGQVMPVSATCLNGSCQPATGAPCATGADPIAASGVCPSGACPSGGCPNGMCDAQYGGFLGRGRGYRPNWREVDWSTSDSMGAGVRARTQAHSLAFENAMGGPPCHTPHLANHDPSGHAMIDYLRCKFGYFIPTGGGGAGVPWVGCYSRVYPQNPYYSDSRDGQTYAAQGYGVPMAVPLAPVVGHAYDYSWGVPSSRLTPISHPAY